MTRYILILLFLVSAISSSAQVGSTSYRLMLKMMLSDKTPAVTVPQAVKMAPAAVLLDTRSKEEFAVSHLPGARFAGYKEFGVEQWKGLPLNTPIIVYCSIGKRSEEVTLKLRAAGYSRVYNLYGGLFEWVNQGHPLSDKSGRATRKVHGYNRFWAQWVDKGEVVY